ncbi:polyprenyl synthetase family protein [Micrococcales bacterium 31B]|nr:polyprenyl synthetase family protein [Micrococcales bacterium 31B]
MSGPDLPAPTLSASPLALEVRARIDEIMASHAPQQPRLGETYARLWGHTTATSRGGKLVRAHLLLGAYDALTRGEPQPAPAPRDAALDVAAAVELLHHAFLLIDDVIDGDHSRRGAPNLPGQLLAEAGSDAPAAHWAASASILMGTDMLSLAHHIALAHDALRPSTQTHLARLWRLAVTDSVAGELLDVGLADGVIAPTSARVESMTALKTATYTFELPLRAAACLAGRAELDDTLRRIGQHLGLGFQLQDDILSVFGDSAHHGKPAFSDLREGKHTLLLSHARHTTAWAAIRDLLDSEPFTPETARALADLLEDCGARTEVDRRITDHFASASNLLYLVPSALESHLEDLVGRLKDRAV